MSHSRSAVLEAEHLRIARELHDEVGQTLTGVMLQVEGLAGVVPADLCDQLDELRETARHGIEEVRRIAGRLRPETLETLGLPSALAGLATAVADQANLVIRRHLEPTPGLSAEHELVVYRIAQEALANVARHAAAENVDLVLAHSRRQTALTVADDGRGIAPGSSSSAHGIGGMRERATLIGADLTISARPGGGTRVQLIVPHATL
jgi:two-component system sensor histidine kinase UhpB